MNFLISEKFSQLQASASRSSHAPGCWTQSSSSPTKQTFFLAAAQVDLDGSEISAVCEDVLRVAYMLDRH